MSVIEIPQLCLVVLVGPSGSGKSTFAHRHFRDSEVLSSDVFRAMVADDPADQSATADAFAALLDVAERRLRRGLLTVIDATSVRPEDRSVLLDLAKAQDVFAVAVVLDLPLSELTERVDRRLAQNPSAPDRAVATRQHKMLRERGKNLRKEGFRFVHTLVGAAAVDAASIVRTRLFNDRTDEHGPFDVIGDVHGCFAELCVLLGELGWTLRSGPDGVVIGAQDHPDGRRVVFVGDLVDRGPQTPAVLRLVMDMVALGQAICVRGNHEEKLLRALRSRNGRDRSGKPMSTGNGLAESLSQLEGETTEFVTQVTEFLDGLVSHLVFDGGRLVVSHAGLAERFHGRTSGRVRNLAMYGETTGETDRWGYPIRVDWARAYRGSARVVYGHTPVAQAAWRNNTLCLDTGCVFGGRLTALRYPESEIVDVGANAVHWAPEQPMGYGDSTADTLLRSELALADVTGKRVIRTRFGGSVTIREEHAAAALEIMSRFAVDPRWLRYLPPTMSPVGSRNRDLLEDPRAAFAYYAELGVAEVICERKHMGSRGILVVTRDDGAARVAFDGVDGAGALYTRTGRAFFDAQVTEGLLRRARAAALPVLDESGWDWMILDAEVLPWNIKGDGLIRDHFAEVAATASDELECAESEIREAAARGLPVADMLDAVTRNTAEVAAFTAAYLDHVHVGADIDDVRVAVFEVLAAGSGSHAQTFGDRSHDWHLEVADRLVEAGPEVFAGTDRLVVDTGSAASCDAATDWWERITATGGEGMVVKPRANQVRDDRDRPVPAGVKVRGPEYLRIIYGPGYLSDLERLRARDLRHKRSMAQREYQLGREALARHVEGAPLWQVHECVFGVLALESEPVDSRL